MTTFCPQNPTFVLIIPLLSSCCPIYDLNDIFNPVFVSNWSQFFPKTMTELQDKTWTNIGFDYFRINNSLQYIAEWSANLAVFDKVLISSPSIYIGGASYATYKVKSNSLTLIRT